MFNFPLRIPLTVRERTAIGKRSKLGSIWQASEWSEAIVTLGYVFISLLGI